MPWFLWLMLGGGTIAIAKKILAPKASISNSPSGGSNGCAAGGWASLGVFGAIDVATRGAALARRYDPGSSVLRGTSAAGISLDGVQNFSSQEKLLGASLMPDGTPILVKYPSDDRPNWVYDLKGRWFYSSGMGLQLADRSWIYSYYVPAHWPGYQGPDSSSLLDKIGAAFVEWAPKLALAALTIVAPEVGVPAGIAYAAVSALAAGAPLTQVGASALGTVYQKYGGTVSALAPLRAGYEAIEQRLPVSVVRAARSALSPTVQDAYDQGMVVATAKVAQQSALAALKARYPSYAAVIQEAFDWGGGVVSIAEVLGGCAASTMVTDTIKKVQQSQVRLT